VVGQYAVLCLQDRCGTEHTDCGPLQGFGEELLTRCLNIVSGLLADDLYFARRQGGQLATLLYRKWARPQVSTNLTPAPQRYFSAAPFALGAVIKQPAISLVVIGLVYKAYPDGCRHKHTLLPRLRPYPVRGHRL